MSNNGYHKTGVPHYAHPDFQPVRSLPIYGTDDALLNAGQTSARQYVRGWLRREAPEGTQVVIARRLRWARGAHMDHGVFVGVVIIPPSRRDNETGPFTNRGPSDAVALRLTDGEDAGKIVYISALNFFHHAILGVCHGEAGAEGEAATLGHGTVDGPGTV